MIFVSDFLLGINYLLLKTLLISISSVPQKYRMVEVERDSWKSPGLTLLLEWGPRITSLWLLKINKYHRLMEENLSNRDRKKKNHFLWEIKIQPDKFVSAFGKDSTEDIPDIMLL